MVTRFKIEPCPLCGGKGWTRTNTYPGQPGWNQLQPCACTRAERALQNAERYGLTTGEYEHMRLDAYQPETPSQKTALQAARIRCGEWANGSRWEGLRFYSQGKGLGKTHLGVGMLWSAALQGLSVAAWTMPALFDDLLAAFSARNGDAAALTEIWQNVDVLLLDDVGAERRTGDLVVRLYFTIFDARLIRHKTTIVTTNLRHEEFEAYTDDRCASRLMALCGKPIGMSGEDYRARPPKGGR